MKHNQHSEDFQFVHEPLEFSLDSPKEILQYALGGTLYMPGTKEIADKIINGSLPDLKSMVMCFEDSIAEEDLPKAETNVLKTLSKVSNAVINGQCSIHQIPLIFLRVRSEDQYNEFSQKLTLHHLAVLSGFVFPKFRTNNAGIYLSTTVNLSSKFDKKLYSMPILEGHEIAYRETRLQELVSLYQIMKPYSQYILNIRVGGTDFCSLFGARRGITSSVYDILPVRDTLSDIINFFNRADDGYVISGPVWEYFLAGGSIDIANISVKGLHRSLLTQHEIVNEAIDGLLREIFLDKANGFVGKTVIHPSHLRYVNAMQAVTLEEFNDATQILNTSGGVAKSLNSNKMNEINPHRNWALRINSRAKIYGVIHDQKDYISLFDEKV